MRVTATAGDDAYPSTDDLRWPVQTIAGWVPVSDEVRSAYTVPIDFREYAFSGMLYDFEPWRRPNRNPMPRLVPFPRLARAQRRASAALQRARDAVDVLRHGLPETDW